MRLSTFLVVFLISCSPVFAQTPVSVMTIRFDRPDVAYQQPLYAALAKALHARPNATIDVLAFSPNAAMQIEGQRQAQGVLRAITDMGVPGSRLAISFGIDSSISANEVRVYVR